MNPSKYQLPQHVSADRQRARSETLRLERARFGLKPDVITMDIEMPEMDGFTLTRKIKTEPAFQSIPVVIHSSLSGSANEDHVRSVGADGYVAKFVAEDLAETIRRVLPH